MVSVFPPDSKYKIFIGNKDEWHVELLDNKATTPDGKHVTANLLDNGAILNLSFTGGGRGVAYIGSIEQDWNLTSHLKSGSYLNFDTNIQQPPTDTTEVHVESWYPTLGSVDMTRRFSQQTMNTWQTYSIDLACFSKNGANFEKVNILFWVGTDGELDVSFSNIHWGEKAAYAEVISCDE